MRSKEDRFARTAASVIEDPRLEHGAFRVLSFLISFADREGLCRFYGDKELSANNIAKALGMTRSTVMRHIKKLRVLGHLSVTTAHRRDGGKAPNRYRVNVPHFHRSSDPTGDPSGQKQPSLLLPFNGGPVEPMSTGATSPCPPVGQAMSEKSDMKRESRQDSRQERKKEGNRPAGLSTRKRIKPRSAKENGRVGWKT
jgi:DNA-binding transcriptional ArsR family regulator